MARRIIAFALGGILLTVLTTFAAGGQSSSASVGQREASPPSADQQPLQAVPMFRATVGLDVLDVVVRDSKTGRFIRDLTKDDFTILDDGRPQTVASLALVDLPRTLAASATASRVASDHVVTNQHSSGRVIMFFINDPTIGARNPYVLDLLHRFVDQHMAVDDQVAVWPASYEIPRQDFTSDRSRLDAAIDKLGGYSEDIGSGDPWKALYTLDGIVGGLARFSNQRKIIVWLGGLPDPMRAPDPVEGDEVLQEYNRVIAEAAAANVAIYPVSATGVMGHLELFLNIVAEETGGVVADTNNFDGALTRIEHDAGTYYMLGFSPGAADKRDGTLHKLSVHVNRPDAVVVTRSRYLPFVPGAEAFEVSPFAVPVTDLPLLPLEDPGIPLSMQATCFNEPGRDDIVVATVRVDLPGTQFSGRTVEYEVAAVDDHGRVTDSNNGASLVPKEDVVAPSITIVSALHVAPGLWTIRAAVKTDHRQAGSVFLNLDAPNLKRSLALSDVEMTSSAEHLLVIGKPPAFLTRRLPQPPTTARTFEASDTLSLYGEVYSSAKASRVSATLTVLGAGEAVERRINLPLTADRASVGRSRFNYMTRLPLAGLTVGPHTLEIRSSLGGETETRRVVITIAGPSATS